jgi:hypothetical protein
MLVRGALAWLALPEFLIEEGTPRICNVLKVGIAVVPATEARSAGIETGGLPKMPPGVCLPTITIEMEQNVAEGLFRLPLGLANWVLDAVALTREFGKSPFPGRVEFRLHAGYYEALGL